jgi:putative addiction module component (TIGR02574 family)
MNHAELADKYSAILERPIEERLLLINMLWQSIDAEHGKSSLTDEMREMLIQRSEDYDKGRAQTSSMREVIEELRNRLEC